MSELVRWNTPFTDTIDPSVGIYVQHGEHETDLVTAIVAPHGINEYPKYLIHFREIIEYSCFEEGYSPKRTYHSASIENENLSAYQWLNSPNVEAYEKGTLFIGTCEDKKPNHYIIFGGDNIIQVVTQNEPEIETINEKSQINIELQV